MRLTVLGGSSASPNPGMGCSGYLVESGTTRIVLDFGAGILPELRRHADFRRLNGIVISHMHLDHMQDLLILRHALTYNPVPASAPIPVWLPPGGRVMLAQATAPFDQCDEPGRFERTVLVRDYDPNAPLVIGELRIMLNPTVHYLSAFAMRVTDTGGRAIGYTADTGPTADLAPFFAGASILIAEATLLDPAPLSPELRGSLTAAEAGTLARQARVETLVLTHMWEERGVAKALDQAATTYPGRIELARPGLSIEV